jgi:hypothetical protein
MMTGLLVGIFVGFCLSASVQVYFHVRKHVPSTCANQLPADGQEPTCNSYVRDDEELRIRVNVLRGKVANSYYYDLPAEEARKVMENTIETMTSRKEGAIRIADGIFKIEEIVGIDMDKH